MLVSLLLRRKKADLRFMEHLLGAKRCGLLCLCAELPRKPGRREFRVLFLQMQATKGLSWKVISLRTHCWLIGEPRLNHHSPE